MILFSISKIKPGSSNKSLCPLFQCFFDNLFQLGIKIKKEN